MENHGLTSNFATPTWFKKEFTHCLIVKIPLRLNFWRSSIIFSILYISIYLFLQCSSSIRTVFSSRSLIIGQTFVQAIIRAQFVECRLIFSRLGEIRWPRNSPCEGEDLVARQRCISVPGHSSGAKRLLVLPQGRFHSRLGVTDLCPLLPG